MDVIQISRDQMVTNNTVKNAFMVIRTPAQTMAILRQIARSLSSAVDLDSTLDMIVRKTTEMMQVDSCTIYLRDAGTEVLRLQATTGLAKRALGRSFLRVGEGMTGVAVLRGEPIYAAKAQEDPNFKWVDEAEERDLQSLLAVPLIIEDKSIGAINVQTLDTHRFDEEEIEFLALIADLAAGAISKAQLFETQKRQLQELKVLARLSEAVTAPQYLEDMLDVVTEMAAQTMEAAVCSIFLLDERGENLVLHSAQRNETLYSHRPPLPFGMGVIGQVAQTGHPVYVPDVRSDERYLGQERAQEEGLVSLLSVPLTVRERVIGVMNCYTAEEQLFTAKQTSFFMTLANQTALAIENAQLVTNAAVIREMHHRIKNNLQTVAMLMRLQMMEAHKLTTAEVLELNISRIQSIAAVHEVLSEKGFRLVDVQDVLKRIAQTTEQMMIAPNKSIKIDVFGDPLPLPSKAATALVLVVNELVLNSIEHGFAEQDEGRVEVSLGRSHDELIILVRDDGSGLSADMTKGLGMEIAETLVSQDLNGRLKYNQPDTGTEVSIRLPRTLEQDLTTD